MIFFKVLLKFKMAATDQLHNFSWAQKLENLKTESIQILQSHKTHGNVQVILLKLEMAATSRLLNYLWAQDLGG